MDKFCYFLKERVEATENEEIKQIIWRVLVVGWYKFARNAKDAIKLLMLFLKNSKPEKSKTEE